MRLIPLTQGKFAMVDDEDFEALIRFKWGLLNGYPARHTVVREGEHRGRCIIMHRAIMHASPTEHVDHINGIILDNRKRNLRFATHQQNLFNRGKTRKNTSGFKGVSWHKQDKLWRAQIVVSYKAIHLGLFRTPEEASAAYKIAAVLYHGEFSRA